MGDNKYNPEGSQLRKLQLRLYEMLLEIDSFCKQNGISYTLEGGTALGAYRHKGFIPWDDDIDIAMNRENYKKFCRLMEQNPPSGLRLQTHKTDRLYLYGYAKVRDVRSFFKESGQNIEYKNNGCFIDVFPFECSFPILIGIYHLIHKPLFMLDGVPLHKKPFLQRVASCYFAFCQLIALFFRFISSLLRCKIYSYGYGCNIYTYKWNYRKDMFKDPKFLTFENSVFPVPGKIEEYLCIHYGPNYMDFPPEEKRTSHHIVSVEGV